MRKAEKGFTLIELLIVTAVIGVLAVVSATVFSSILRSQNKTAITNEVRQNGNLLIDKFDRDVKQASEILPLGASRSVDLTIEGGTITWACVPGGTFTRNLVSVINEDSTSGVQVEDSGAANDCQFIVTDVSPQNTQIVTLEFSLEQADGAPGKAEFEVNVPFEVTVGTRAYH